MPKQIRIDKIRKLNKPPRPGTEPKQDEWDELRDLLTAAKAAK